METRSKRGHGYELRSRGCSKCREITSKAKSSSRSSKKPKPSDDDHKTENGAPANKLKLQGENQVNQANQQGSPKKPKPSDDLKIENQDKLKLRDENQVDRADQHGWSIGESFARFAAQELRLSESLELSLKQAKERRLGLPGSLKRKRLMKDYKHSMWEFANQALEFYRKQGGGTFQLVDAVSIGQGLLQEGLVRHVNFKAKKKYDPNAMVLTFFAQLTQVGLAKDRVDICICLGATAKLPAYGDTRGCNLCSPGAVHHPPGIKFKGTIYG